MLRIVNFFFKAKRIRVSMLVLGDMLSAVAVLLGVAWAYKFFQDDYSIRIYFQLYPFLIIFILVNMFSRSYHGNVFYPGICLNKIDEIRRLSLSVIVTYLLLFTWLMFNRSGIIYSRVVLFSAMVFTVLIVPLVRFFVRYAMQKCNFCLINCFIVGAGKTGELIAQELEISCYYGFRVVGFLDDTEEKQGTVIAGVPCVGKLDNAKSLAIQYNVHYCICCLPLNVVENIFLSYSKIFPHIMFVPDNRVFPMSWLKPASIGLYGGFEVRNELLLGIPRIMKKVYEVVFAVITIVCLLPLLAVLAILVKLSTPGPVFYAAKRLGLDGKVIKVLKFRTMYYDAESRLQYILDENPELAKEWESKFKLANDPRITPIGKFLRKTSLDELPQFWNVISGEMAIIGPRPIVEEEVPYYGSSYELLKRVKPGITGLWQVSGRSDVDYINRVTLDTYYIVNWSLWIDYYIFFKTIFVVLIGRGAC